MSDNKAVTNEPFVSIVTPVYNGERYLAECIESVLAQSYGNWEYVIVDNESRDRSREIAESYAAQDERIRVCVNANHEGVIPDWNYAMRQIAADSHFCKVVHADDWLFPNCLRRMVAVATKSDSIGLVGAYRLAGRRVELDGLPYGQAHFAGRDIGRLCLKPFPLSLFGSPSAVLYKASLVRSRERFYDESYIHADKAVCFEILQSADFAFVHQVLTFKRTHEGSVSAVIDQFGTRRVDNLMMLKKYGPIFLDAEVYERRWAEQSRAYYSYLLTSVAKIRSPEYREYHREKLRQLAIRLPWTASLRLMVRELVRFPARQLSQRLLGAERSARGQASMKRLAEFVKQEE